MTQLQLNKLVSFLGKLIAFIVLLGIILAVIVLTLKPKIVALLNNTEQQGPIVNGVVRVEGDLPFYDEFVKGYRQCKLSTSADCYCQLPYAGTPDGYVLELSNSGTTTSIRVNGGAEVDYGLTSTNRASLTQIEGARQINTRDNQISSDILYFLNHVRGPFSFFPTSLPASDNGKLSIADFTIVNKQFIYKKNMYSTKDVSGSDRVNIEKGIALYKFDDQKAALYPLEATQSLKRCNQVENILNAEDEFNRFLSLVNDCVRTNERNKCQYIKSLPNDYSLHVEDKKFVLKYKGTTIKSSNTIAQNLCVFNDFRNVQLAQARDLSTFDFADNYVEVDFYNFPNNLCILPYTQAQAQQKRLQEERASFTTNLPIAQTTLSSSGLCKAGAIGDSITEGGYYTNRLKNRCGADLFESHGVRGQRTNTILGRFDSDILANNYKDAMILAGVNDLVSDISVENIESNLSAMYAKAKQKNMRVIAITLTPWKGYSQWNEQRQGKTEQINEWVRNHPANVDIVVDAYTTLNDGTDKLKPEYDPGDHLHPNLVGYNALGDAIFAVAYNNAEECKQQLQCTSVI